MSVKGLLPRASPAHIADIAKNVRGARERDRKMSQCRKEFRLAGTGGIYPSIGKNGYIFGKKAKARRMRAVPCAVNLRH